MILSFELLSKEGQQHRDNDGSLESLSKDDEEDRHCEDVHHDEYSSLCSQGRLDELNEVRKLCKDDIKEKRD